MVCELHVKRAIMKKITTQNHIVTALCRGLTESLCLLQDNLS